jgi:hypothetical protein
VRKFAAIFFLAVLCFNCLGYRAVFDYLEKKHNRHLEAILDQENYNESELISVKTSFRLPYYNASDKFERCNGEIKINGIHYKYVKRRIINDSIELLCIPNMAATRLNEAKQDFFRVTNDLSSNGDKKQDSGQVPAFKNLLSEYCQQVPDWDLAIAAIRRSHHFSFYLLSLPQYTGDSPGQPPEYC